MCVCVFIYMCTTQGSKLPSFCRAHVIVDPLLWLSMTQIERSRCVRWHLGWLPGYTKYCPKQSSNHLTKNHVLSCLDIHNQLMLPQHPDDPISFLFNLLPTRPLKSSDILTEWSIRWPILYSILMQIDCMYHDTLFEDSPESIGRILV